MKKLKKITFRNGLRLLLVPEKQSLAASVLILVEAGSEYETKERSGLSHFLEHLVFKGTEKRPRPQLVNEELDALGAQSNAFTSQQYTGYWVKAEYGKLPHILDVVSDLYLHPIFDANELERERGVIYEEINYHEDSPARKVYDLLLELLYGKDQPAGWDIAGTKETVGSITKEDVVNYRKERYVMPGTVVAIAGRFNEKKIVEQIKGYFAKLPKNAAPKKTKTKEVQKEPQILVRFKESEQSHLIMAFRAFDMFDKRRYALQVLSDILGGGMSSRLWQRVREELGAAYYVSSDADLLLDRGLLAIAAGVGHRKMEEVLRVVLEECRRLRNTLVPAKELQKAKDHMVGNLVLGLEASDELASFYGAQEILTKSTLSPEALIGRIKRVTAKDVQSVARAVFTERGLNLALIGPYKDGAEFKKLLTL